MKKFVIILLLLSHGYLFGQIKYVAFGVVYPRDVDEFEMLPELKPLEKIADTPIVKIMRAFRETNIQAIKPLLSLKLQKETGIIDSLLNNFEKIFGKLDSTYLFENPFESSTQTGARVGITRFSNRKNKNLIINYEYCIRGDIVVTRIKINNTTFPTDLHKFWKLFPSTRDGSLTVQEKYKIHKELVRLITPEKGDDSGLLIPSSQLSNIFGSLSWYALNIGKNGEAIEAAHNGLKYYPENIWINTNLALGYAQNDQIEEAKQIYLKYKKLSYGSNPFKDMFLNDIKDLEKKGFKVKHKETIIKILNQ